MTLGITRADRSRAWRGPPHGDRIGRKDVTLEISHAERKNSRAAERGAPPPQSIAGRKATALDLLHDAMLPFVNSKRWS